MAGRMNQSEAMELLDYEPETGFLRWKVSPRYGIAVGDLAGHRKPDGYLSVKIRGQQYQLHRVVWLIAYGDWPKRDIDHIDGCRTNNAIANLRDVDRTTNSQNIRKCSKNNKASGLLGVSAVRGKWQSKINVGGRSIYLGVYATPEEAHHAYLSAKRVLHAGCTI